jgi:hypothetical protein
MIRSRNESQKFGLTFTGLRRLLKSAIQLSFVMPRGAGGWSFSPNITYYPTVDEEVAPAFRLMSLLRLSRHYDALDFVTWWEKLVPLAVSRILKLFQAGQADPRAVDARNRSLAHHLAAVVCVDAIPRYSLTSHKLIRYPQIGLTGGPVQLHRRSQAEPSPLLELLECLLLNKAAANEYDIFGE